MKKIIFILVLLLLSSCFNGGNTSISVQEEKQTIESTSEQFPSESAQQNTNLDQQQAKEQATIIIGNTTMQIIAPPTPKNAKEIVNGNIFTYEQDKKVWRTYYIRKDGQVQNLTFRYNPNELKDIKVSGSLSKIFDQKETYITFDPLNTYNLAFVALAAHELSSHLAGSFQHVPVSACTQEGDACPGIATCDDTDKAVIFLNNQPGPEIILNGNCMVLQGQDEDIVKTAERIIFDWYGYYK